MNDGLSFPFDYAAIAISVVGTAPGGWLARWLAVDVAWRLSVGVLMGLGTGWLLRSLFFAGRSKQVRLAEQAEGFVARQRAASSTLPSGTTRSTSWVFSGAPCTHSA